jgi:hypothetical protein
MDGSGKIVCENKVASEPEALAAFFSRQRFDTHSDWFGGRSAVAMTACRADGGGASGDLDRDATCQGGAEVDDGYRQTAYVPVVLFEDTVADKPAVRTQGGALGAERALIVGAPRFGPCRPRWHRSLPL